jgi:phosphate transport system permease protein
MKKGRKYNRQSITSLLLRSIVYSAAAITVTLLVFIVGYILIKGIPNISPQLFAWKYNSENVSLMPALISTVIMTFISLFIAVPLGISAAVYLVEYAKRGNRLVGLVRITSETLSGIPSIIYGLFGLLFFVTTLGWGMSLAAGAFTLSIMILPLIMRTTEEALKSVPDTFREGSFGLGAGRLRTILRIVLPSAVPGILAGVILSIGRIVGETAALIYTAGTVAQVPTSLTDSVRTLSVHLYALSSEGLYMDQTYATAVVLLILVVGINTFSGLLARKIGRRM